MHRRTLLCLAALLTGCAAIGPKEPTGATYAELASLLGTVAPTVTRLNVFWPAADKKFAGVARVTIDQSEVGLCRQGGFITVDVGAGVHVLAVDDTNSGVGRCNLRIDTRGGDESFYEVAPRMEHLQAGLPGEFVAAVPVWPITLLGLAGAYAGMVLESAGKECGGPLSITPIEERAALSKISDLKMSR